MVDAHISCKIRYKVYFEIIALYLTTTTLSVAHDLCTIWLLILITLHDPLAKARDPIASCLLDLAPPPTSASPPSRRPLVGPGTLSGRVEPVGPASLARVYDVMRPPRAACAPAAGGVFVWLGLLSAVPRAPKPSAPLPCEKRGGLRGGRRQGPGLAEAPRRPRREAPETAEARRGARPLLNRRGAKYEIHC